MPLYGLYWNTWLSKSRYLSKYLRGRQRVYLNLLCSVYITLKPDPVSFSCRLPHAKHSFCIPLNLVNKRNNILKIIVNKEGLNTCLGNRILLVFFNVAKCKTAGSYLYTFLCSVWKCLFDDELFVGRHKRSLCCSICFPVLKTAREKMTVYLDWTQARYSLVI